MISSALLWILALAPSPERASEETRKILADEKYGFCHNTKYPLTDVEAGWCPPVGPEKNPRCPAFRSACDAPRAVLQDLGRLSFSRGEGEDSKEHGDGDQKSVEDDPSERADQTGTKSGKRKQPKREVITEEDFAMPELGGLGYVLFWGILGIGMMLLIYVIVRNTTRYKAEEAAPEEAPPLELGPSPGLVGPSEQLVRDVSALLEQARAAASAGDFNKAIQRAHAALLHRLDHDGLIRVAPFRTNGDYVRDLNARPELRSPVREIVRDVEQVQFGTASPDATLYDRVLKRIIPIATRRGETLLLLLLGLGLVACEISKSYPFDRSPSGANAVIELGKVYELDIGFRTIALGDIDPGEDLGEDHKGRTLVLLHDVPYPTDTEWHELMLWADQGHHLVLAGVAPPSDLGVAIESGLSGHHLKVSSTFVDTYGELDLITADEDHLVSTRTDGAVLLETPTGDPYAIHYERAYSGGDITVFADDRLFTSGGLMLRDNPEFLVRFLIELGASDIEFADGLLDLGADTPAEAIANTHLTPVILQLMALLAILYFWRGVRFGRPVDPPMRSRRQFTEHVEALGSQYARARASRHAVRLYAAWALDRLRERTQTSRQPGLYPLAQAIAGRTGDDENRVMETLAEASSLQGDAGASRIAGRTSIRALAHTTDLRLMQDLARLVRLVGGPR